MTPLALAAVPVSVGIALTPRIMRSLAASVLVATALFGAVAACVFGVVGAGSPAGVGARYVVVDPTARLFLVLVNVLFLGIAVYAWNRVRTAPELGDEGARFAPLALFFMAACDCAILSNHLLGMWIALETTTVAAAQLIIRRDVPSSCGASWRYFLFSSVGLGVALLGFLCLRRSLEVDGYAPTLFLDRLTLLVSGPPNIWRKLGLALVFLGYGTKLGLAPMYSWLPETYDEAPPAVTAMLAAVQFNCVLVGILRVLQIYRAENRSFVSNELVVVGLASMAVSTVSIIATHNLKRLVAYASINHGGVIAIGLGIGKTAAFGVLLYAVSNAFIKAILFLTAGKIQAHYQTKDTREIAGLIKDLPYSGVFLMVGTFALLGFPPFGSFLGELMILSSLVSSGHVTVFALFCALITITFVATGRTVFPMIWGKPTRAVAWPRQTLGGAVPKLAFLVALVAMGIYMPPVVSILFRQVAATLGGE